MLELTDPEKKDGRTMKVTDGRYINSHEVEPDQEYQLMVGVFLSNVKME